MVVRGGQSIKTYFSVVWDTPRMGLSIDSPLFNVMSPSYLEHPTFTFLSVLFI